MRQIKFRGQRVDNKQWVYGTYHYCTGPGKMRSWDYKDGNRVFEDKAVEFNSHWILVHHTPDEKGWTERDTYTPYAVIPETVGQYTGLTDKNGKDIYEGDVLERIGTKDNFTQLPMDVTTRELVVVELRVLEDDFGGKSFGFSLNTQRTYSERSNPATYEIIGNKFDNPELLNK